MGPPVGRGRGPRGHGGGVAPGAGAMSLAWAASLAVPALVAVAVIGALRSSRIAARLADRPNERSLHTVPTPRVGGLGVMAGALPVAAAFAGSELGALLACAAALAAVSVADDLRSLPIAVRLPAHCVAAGLAVLVLGAPSPAFAGLGWAGAVAIAIALVWATNLFNFMDGADGLAGGMAAIGFAALAVAAVLAGAQEIALACAALASAAAGFLLFNFPPAKVFLGDAGSIPLGFLAGALGVAGAIGGAWPGWFPVLVFSPFVVDATATIARRLLGGEPVWIAHRSHYYQRLALSGWPRRRLALAAWALMAAAAGSALLALRSDGMLRCAILSVWVAAYFLLARGIDRRPTREHGAPRPSGR